MQQAAEDQTAAATDEDGFVHLAELRGWELPSEPAARLPTTRRPASVFDMETKPVLQRRWTIHDGLFFAQHCRFGKPETTDEHMWLLQCTTDQPRGVVAAAPAPASSNPDEELSTPTLVGHAELENSSQATEPPPPDACTADATPAHLQLAAVSAAPVSEKRGDLSDVAAPAAAPEEDVTEQIEAPTAEASTAVEATRPIPHLPRLVFQAAFKSADLPIVREWLREGGDINAAEEGRGWTLLMAAAVCDNHLLLCELLQRGAAPEVMQRSGSTALALAAMQGSCRAAELLLEANAAANTVDHMGMTAFMCASIKGHTALATLLRGHGARSAMRVGEYVTRVKKLDAAGEVWGVQRAYRGAGGSSTISQETSQSEGSSWVRPGDEADADACAQRLIEEEEAEKASMEGGASPRGSFKKKNKKGRAKTR